jgi:hypothetical protein
MLFHARPIVAASAERYRHKLLTHVWPWAQALPHAPQLLLSYARSVHPLRQEVCPAGHKLAVDVHEYPLGSFESGTHAGVGAVHVRPQRPQLEASMGTHVDTVTSLGSEQSICPAGQSPILPLP